MTRLELLGCLVAVIAGCGGDPAPKTASSEKNVPQIEVASLAPVSGSLAGMAVYIPEVQFEKPDVPADTREGFHRGLHLALEKIGFRVVSSSQDAHDLEAQLKWARGSEENNELVFSQKGTTVVVLRGPWGPKLTGIGCFDISGSECMGRIFTHRFRPLLDSIASSPELARFAQTARATKTSPTDGSSPLPPPPTSASPAPEAAGCQKDTDCKGDRICNAGVCVTPRQPSLN